jgi:dTDP-glucose 4,6-dehydratase
MTTTPTYIVTGGAGFIGANFVRLALRETDARVVVFDKLTYAGHLESLAEVSEHSRYAFVQGDIADAQEVAELYRAHQPTAVLNFAAESHVDRSIDDPGAFMRTNILGAYELVEASRAHLDGLTERERERFRFLHVSTDEVYGTLGDDGMFTETTPYAPNSPYAASKASADHVVRSYYETFRLPAIITNCSNNYGPFQFPEKLIPLMTLNALEGKPLPIYGDGGNVRDWLHVEDHCRGILLALTRGAPGGRYNLGGRAERTNLEVVEAICRALEDLRPARDNEALKGRGASAYGDLKTFVADRPGHDRRYAIDPTLSERELGFSPRHGFEDGIRATVRWYLDNRAWCDAVQGGGYGRERLGLSKLEARP